ncbi:unnamed protein product [Strongylus vulgaris]|uniref:Uncharacterized protein n=1 Tax=Strongylus vulgaris TaxID=40348 RepID=A0A3P7IHQ7_STRVU|nr:unnamed protein product [Strongylus vulgaris]
MCHSDPNGADVGKLGNFLETEETIWIHICLRVLLRGIVLYVFSPPSNGRDRDRERFERRRWAYKGNKISNSFSETDNLSIPHRLPIAVLLTAHAHCFHPLAPGFPLLRFVFEGLLSVRD